MLLTLSVCAATLTPTLTNAQSNLIHYWHFNNLSGAHNNPNIPALKADYSAIDTNNAQLVYQLVTGASDAYAGYIDDVSGSDSNARLGISAGRAYRLRNPSDSVNMLIYAPTTGNNNIVIKYAIQSSSTNSGMLAHLFDYSVDSGVTWLTTGLNVLIDSASQHIDPDWGITTISFSDTSVNDNPQFVFRIRFDGNTQLTSGNNRFDNLTVEGNLLSTSVNSITKEAVAGYIYPNPATDNITLYTQLKGLKNISVFSADGRRVGNTQTAQSTVMLPISDLPTGVYYAHISAEGRIQVLSFEKR